VGNKPFIVAVLAIVLIGSIGVGAYILGRRSIKPAPTQITTVRDTVRVDSVQTRIVTRTRTVTDVRYEGNESIEHLADSLLALTDSLLWHVATIEDLRAEADTTIEDTRLLLGYSYRARAFDVEIIREHTDTTATPVVTECSSGWWKYAVGGAVGMLVTLVFAIAM
jgi:hypothetical protein